MNNNMNTKERLALIADLRQSGEYSIATIEMFDKVKELEMNERLYSRLKYTDEVLKEYLEEIMELDASKPGLLEFLKAIRVADVIDNQSLEKENSFLIGLYSQLSRETAMGRLIKYAKSGKELVGKDIFSLHNTLLYGTLSEDVSSLRTENSTFVGKYGTNGPEIDYFPIDCKDVKEAASKLADIYNNKLDGEIYDNLFIQPFLIHGLFGALQLFKDGNTRMGRVMQHALLWRFINQQTTYSFDSPPIFATRSYFPVRYDYRSKINDLVTLSDNNPWYQWFDFNLNRVEDIIYVNRENIKELKLRKKYSR